MSAFVRQVCRGKHASEYVAESRQRDDSCTSQHVSLYDNLSKCPTIFTNLTAATRVQPYENLAWESISLGSHVGRRRSELRTVF